MRRRLSLRARLILGVIALAAVGLLAADAVTYTQLRSFEISRTDSSLDAAHLAVEQPLFGGNPLGGPGPAGHRPPQPNTSIGTLAAAAPGYCVELLRPNGTVLSSRCNPQLSGGTSLPAPKLPATLDLPAAANGHDSVHYFTTGAVEGSTRYRVRASIEPSAPNLVLVVAAPLSSIESTLHRLLLVEGAATAAVLVGIAVLGLWVVRLGLRPLESMSRTAGQIAAGDLSRRVEPADGHTEVGRLGLALNAMLAHIEAAVTDRDDSLRALAASEAKLRRFIADASHELRTPLTAVRAYAELFSRGAASRPDDLERSMTGISRESERMSVLVEDLLLLAHLDEGRPVAREPVRLDDVAREAVETARTLEPDRPVELALEETTISGDRDRLRQVVDNLLANVRAHTPPEAPLHVSVGHESRSAVLVVADGGPGMGPEQLEHVFERFYRADHSRARVTGGAGLGLAIVQAVVAAHGGEVGVESDPERGTTVTVRLPVER
jgi:two-component system, OmpR family, sensor kinase